MTQKQADRLIAEFGPNGEKWINYRSSDVKIKLCLVQAVTRVFGLITWKDEEKKTRSPHVELEQAVRRFGAYHLSDFNESPGRTFEDVKAMINSCVVPDKIVLHD